MERLFKELKDYTRIRGYFQSEESADKFLYLSLVRSMRNIHKEIKIL